MATAPAAAGTAAVAASTLRRPDLACTRNRAHWCDHRAHGLHQALMKTLHSALILQHSVLACRLTSWRSGITHSRLLPSCSAPMIYKASWRIGCYS